VFFSGSQCSGMSSCSFLHSSSSLLWLSIVPRVLTRLCRWFLIDLSPLCDICPVHLVLLRLLNELLLLVIHVPVERLPPVLLRIVRIELLVER